MDCAPGLACHRDPVLFFTTCVPPASLGEDCTDVDCAAALFCPFSGVRQCQACSPSIDAGVADGGVPDASDAALD